MDEILIETVSVHVFLLGFAPKKSVEHVEKSETKENFHTSPPTFLIFG